VTDDGTWVPSRADYLFPVKVMARLFRRLFREALLAAIARGEVEAPREVIERARDAMFQKKWHVYAKPPFGGAEQVFAYLGRYTHRVGISNARIVALDERGVTFATRNGATCTLDAVEFLRRLLLHVLPKGFHKIRHYGLCSATHVTLGTLEAAREKLGPSPALLDKPRPTPAATPETFVDCMLALTGVDVLRCPRCGEGPMLRVALELACEVAFEDTS
jgi:hypothetical protein